MFAKVQKLLCIYLQKLFIRVFSTEEFLHRVFIHATSSLFVPLKGSWEPNEGHIPF